MRDVAYMSQGGVGCRSYRRRYGTGGGGAAIRGIGLIQCSYLRQAVTLQAGSTTRRSSKSYTGQQAARERTLLGATSEAWLST
jgi:hypothetical protein